MYTSILEVKISENLEKSLGAAQSNLSTKQINGIQIPILPIKERKHIVAHIEALAEHTHALESETRERLYQFAILKFSLLDAALRSQLSTVDVEGAFGVG